MANVHIVSQIRENTQILFTVLSKWGDVLGGTGLWVNEEKTVFICNPAYLNHPLVLWASACRAHVLWLFQHVKAMCREYTRRNNGNKIHDCEYMVDYWKLYVETNGFHFAMPHLISASDWLASFNECARARLANRIAHVNPPENCEFGVIALLDFIPSNPANWTESYQEYYLHKERTSKVKLVWGTFKNAEKRAAKRANKA